MQKLDMSSRERERADAHPDEQGEEKTRRSPG
jgi:hypothetical protein